MPTYTYNGTVTFINNDYNVRANPGDSITTTTFLPDTWTDFTLTDGTGAANVPKSETIALSTNVDTPTDVTNYEYITITFVGTPTTEVIEVRTGDTNQDDAVLLTVDQQSIELYIKEINNVILTATTGTPSVLVTKSYTRIYW